MSTPLRSRLAAAGIALVLAAGMASCSDDDTDVASGGGDDPTETPSGAMSESACEAATTLSTAALGPDDDDVTGWVQSTLQPAAETLVGEYDGEVTVVGASAEILADELVAVADSGDMEMLFESEEITRALDAIGNSAHRSCGYQEVDVQAVDFAYEGLPSELEAGMTSFALTNDGIEDHEIVIFRRADGATETLEELLELPEEEGMAKMEFTGVAFGGPDTTAYTTLDLTPGTYFVVCFIPTGGEDGPPHFMEGMSDTFTVA